MFTTIAAGLFVASISVSPLTLIKVGGQSSEAMRTMGHAKVYVSEYLASSGGKIPSNNAEARLDSPTALAANNPLVETVTVGYGTISATFSEKAHKLLRGQTLAMSVCATEDFSDFYFTCGQTFCSHGKLAVQGVQSAFELTTLPNDYLPFGCRGNGSLIAEAKAKAAQGDPEAQRIWSAILLQGAAVPRDLDESFAVAKASAKGGNVTALTIIGVLYSIGVPKGAEPDLARTLAWWRYAERQGHPSIATNIASLLPRLSEEQVQAAEAIKAEIQAELADSKH
ncbi:MAG: pilin [Lysobacterales bacterium]